MDSKNKCYLPLPEINDDLNLSHSFKQVWIVFFYYLNQREASYTRKCTQKLFFFCCCWHVFLFICLQNSEYRHSKKPPKINPKHYDSSFNKSTNCTSAQSISFNNQFNSISSKPLLSPLYNNNNDHRTSYFEKSFQVISKLGEGSFSEVFKVRSSEDGCLYAVKKSKQLYRSEVYRQERLEEVRRYEQFSAHEHCITLYKAWEQDDRLYMQLELCEGSLEDYVEQNKSLSESMIWNIFVDLLLVWFLSFNKFKNFVVLCSIIMFLGFESFTRS